MAKYVKLIRGTGKDRETYNSDSPEEITMLRASGWDFAKETATTPEPPATPAAAAPKK